ncbi:TIGR03757 family integrating conjugative element protein, partial [Pseudomonas syringae pv. tagetis]
FVVYGQTNAKAAENRIAHWRAAANNQKPSGQGDAPR